MRSVCPAVYREAIQQWNASHPNDPFVEASGDTISIEHLDLGGVSLCDLKVTEVIGHLLSNKIPSSWIVFKGPVQWTRKKTETQPNPTEYN